MATRNLVPRANAEGQLGTPVKRWLQGHFSELIRIAGRLACTDTLAEIATAGTQATARGNLGLGNSATRNVDVANGVAGLDSGGNIQAGVRALTGTPTEILTTSLLDSEIAVGRRSTRAGLVRLVVGKSDGTGEGILGGPEWNGNFNSVATNTAGTSRASQTVLELDPVLRLAAPPDAVCRLVAELYCITGVANTGQGGTIPTISFRVVGLTGFVGHAELTLNAPNSLNSWGTGTRYLIRISGSSQTITFPQPENGWTNRAHLRITGMGRTAVGSARSIVGIEWAQSVSDATAAVVLNNSWLLLDPRQIILPELLSVTMSNTAPTASDTIFASVRFVSEGLAALTYQWRVNGNDVSGATSRTFALTGRSVGDSVNCVVTAASTEGGTFTASAATPAVVA